jgi:hypothetical protein
MIERSELSNLQRAADLLGSSPVRNLSPFDLIRYMFSPAKGEVLGCDARSVNRCRTIVEEDVRRWTVLAWVFGRAESNFGGAFCKQRSDVSIPQRYSEDFRLT